VENLLGTVDNLGVTEQWTARSEGADDHAAWTRLARLAPAGGPQAARAWARLGMLERRLA
jgi:hypothetical protein